VCISHAFYAADFVDTARQTKPNQQRTVTVGQTKPNQTNSVQSLQTNSVQSHRFCVSYKHNFTTLTASHRCAPPLPPITGRPDKSAVRLAPEASHTLPYGAVRLDTAFFETLDSFLLAGSIYYLPFFYQMTTTVVWLSFAYRTHLLNVQSTLRFCWGTSLTSRHNLLLSRHQRAVSTTYTGRKRLFRVIGRYCPACGLHHRGEHGQDQKWIFCRILAIFLLQDWI